MGWIRIHVKCTPAEPGRDIATAWLDEAGCSMFQHEGDALMAFGQDSELDRTALDDVKDRLAPLGLTDWQVSEVEEENWNAQWESDYPEVEVGNVVRVSAPSTTDRVPTDSPIRSPFNRAWPLERATTRPHVASWPIWRRWSGMVSLFSTWGVVRACWAFMLRCVEPGMWSSWTSTRGASATPRKTWSSMASTTRGIPCGKAGHPC